MGTNNQINGSTVPPNQKFVLVALEPDQLAARKKKPIPRRQLRGYERFALWSLRIYVIFMITVVLYQVLSGAR